MKSRTCRTYYIWEMHIKICQENPNRKYCLGDVSLSGRIIFFFFSSSDSRIRPMAYPGFYEFHLLRGLAGSLLPSGQHPTGCFGTRPSPVLSACSCKPRECPLVLSLIENTPNSFLISSFLISSNIVHRFTVLMNRISAAYNCCVSLVLTVL
jgi:hypothetical protein